MMLKKVKNLIYALYGFFIAWKYRKKEYILCNRGIGDTIIFLSKLEEYKKNNPSKKINLIVQENQKFLLEGYKQYIDDMAVVDEGRFWGLYKAAIRCWLPKNIKFILPPEAFDLLKNSETSIVDLINLSMNISNFNYVSPTFTWSDMRKIEILEQSKAVKNKTVILAPNAVSVPLIKEEVWEKIAEFYQENGFYVITNLTNTNEIPIKGTLGIRIPLNEIYLLAEFCGYFIGLRSGLCDLLAFSTCQMVVLYPEKGEQDWKKMYSFTNMHFSKRIYELTEQEAETFLKEHQDLFVK